MTKTIMNPVQRYLRNIIFIIFHNFNILSFPKSFKDVFLLGEYSYDHYKLINI